MQKPQQAEERKEKPSGRGVVRAVPSADQLVLSLDKPGHPELEVTLSGIVAPRLGRFQGKGKEETPEEPFASVAREYLRKKVIGKTVHYVINTTATTKAGKTLSFATVMLGDANLSRELLSEGLVKAKLPQGDKAPGKEQAELIALMEKAQTEFKGQFAKTPENSTRKVISTYDPFELCQQLKGKALQGVVEQVRDGCTYRLLLLPQNYDVLVHVAGVQTPVWTFVDKPGQAPPQPGEDRDRERVPQPGAVETKNFVESNLLHRDVTVTIDGQFDKRGTFYATIHTGTDSVADILLKGGWGHFLEWCAPVKDQDRLRDVERIAKEQRLRMWHNAAAVPAAAAGAAPSAAKSAPSTAGPFVTVNGMRVPVEFQGKIRQVGSGGMLTVLNTSVQPAVPVTVQLASVTVPRYGVPNQEDEKWGYEAREFLRTKLIGKKVRVVIDYIKTGEMIREGQLRAAAAREAQAVAAGTPKPEAHRRPPSDKPIPDKIFASVLHDRVNIATRLVEEGLAKVIFHKGEEKRSAYYEALHVAERNAEKKGKHQHSNKDAPKYRFNIIDKPAKFMSFVSRGRQVGVVDWVISPTRFRVLLPNHSAIITLNISGVRGPDRETKWSDDALNFSRDKALHRDIELDIEGADKAGNFVGSLFLKKKNFAVTMLAAGLARVIPPAANKLPWAEEYKTTQRAAQEAHLKMWEEWTPESEQVAAPVQEEEEDLATSAAPGSSPNLVKVQVTELVDAGCFFVQVLSPEKDSLDALMHRFETMNLDAAPAYAPIIGQLALGKFSEDGKWYRVYVAGSGSAAGTFKVTYVDFGNTEELPASAMRAADDTCRALPAQAVECHLAYLHTPGLNEDCGRDAAEYLKQLVWGKPLMMANIEYRDGNRMFVAIGDPITHVHVNASLARAGLARVVKRQRGDQKLMSRLEEEQQLAQHDHIGIWRYGDLLDNEDEGGMPVPKPAAAATAKPNAWGKK